MLNQIDLTQKIAREDYKKKKKELTYKIARLQREINRQKIPVVIVIDGWDGVGKGHLINGLIYSLDYRSLHIIGKDLTAAEDFLHLRKYWKNLPEDGNISLFDRSWNSRPLDDLILCNGSVSEYENKLISNKHFEDQLISGGNLLIKVFFHMDKTAISKKFQVWLAEKARKHYVTSLDEKRHEFYDRYLEEYNNIIKQDFDHDRPWHLIPANDYYFASLKFSEVLESKLSEAIDKKNKLEELKKKEAPVENVLSHQSYSEKACVLKDLNLSSTVSRDDYRKLLKEKQKKLKLLEAQIRNKGIPLALVFEGWDAAGKGGAIKRFIKKLDPRGYQVIPIAAPNAVEKMHHYLWRFWIRMPHKGQIKIFDRSWYGRVMVERLEGFCSETDWKRAFGEINQMESYLANSGIKILKFWIHIDKEEQLKRFEARKKDPEKQWKITDEDWRNRDKWDDYETAVNDMLTLCNQSFAPWHLIEGNCKFHARLQVIDRILEAFESELNSDL